MEWVRGDTIGRGSFGTVSLAIPITNLPPNSTPIVIKSSEIPKSDSLLNEKQILSQLGNNNPHIVQFLGDSLSSERGTQFYNLFFEYAANGSLSDHLRVSGGKFEFSDVKKYTKSILEGLCYVHEKGFVHCDIKLQNILLFCNGSAKIADFGLAKQALEKTGCQLRGTPLYMSPEIVAGGEVESPADIWAVGCAVIEMISGKPAWNCSPECDVSALLYRIGIAGECPVIPRNLCPDGKDFLEKCFFKDPNERWTARMLLDHPFLSGLDYQYCNDDDQSASVSPRCPFEFSDWQSKGESSSGSDSVGSFDRVKFSRASEYSCWSSISSRFGQQVVNNEAVPDWSDTDGWVIVR